IGMPMKEARSKGSPFAPELKAVAQLREEDVNGDGVCLETVDAGREEDVGRPRRKRHTLAGQGVANQPPDVGEKMRPPRLTNPVESDAFGHRLVGSSKEIGSKMSPSGDLLKHSAFRPTVTVQLGGYDP